MVLLSSEGLIEMKKQEQLISDQAGKERGEVQAPSIEWHEQLGLPVAAL